MEALALVAKASSRHSLFKGVTLYKPTSKWRAQISHGGRTVTLGDYGTEEEAARVFDRACICKYGKDAACNFPLEDYKSEWDFLQATTIPALLLKFKEERQRNKGLRACRAAHLSATSGSPVLEPAPPLSKQNHPEERQHGDTVLSATPSSAGGQLAGGTVEGGGVEAGVLAGMPETALVKQERAISEHLEESKLGRWLQQHVSRAVPAPPFETPASDESETACIGGPQDEGPRPNPKVHVVPRRTGGPHGASDGGSPQRISDGSSAGPPARSTFSGMQRSGAGVRRSTTALDGCRIQVSSPAAPWAVPVGTIKATASAHGLRVRDGGSSRSSVYPSEPGPYFADIAALLGRQVQQPLPPRRQAPKRAASRQALDHRSADATLGSLQEEPSHDFAVCNVDRQPGQDKGLDLAARVGGVAAVAGVPYDRVVRGSSLPSSDWQQQPFSKRPRVAKPGADGGFLAQLSQIQESGTDDDEDLQPQLRGLVAARHVAASTAPIARNAAAVNAAQQKRAPPTFPVDWRQAEAAADADAASHAAGLAGRQPSSAATSPMPTSPTPPESSDVAVHDGLDREHVVSLLKHLLATELLRREEEEQQQKLRQQQQLQQDLLIRQVAEILGLRLLAGSNLLEVLTALQTRDGCGAVAGRQLAPGGVVYPRGIAGAAADLLAQDLGSNRDSSSGIKKNSSSNRGPHAAADNVDSDRHVGPRARARRSTQHPHLRLSGGGAGQPHHTPLLSPLLPSCSSPGSPVLSSSAMGDAAAGIVAVAGDGRFAAGESASVPEYHQTERVAAPSVETTSATAVAAARHHLSLHLAAVQLAPSLMAGSGVAACREIVLAQELMAPAEDAAGGQHGRSLLHFEDPTLSNAAAVAAAPMLRLALAGGGRFAAGGTPSSPGGGAAAPVFAALRRDRAPAATNMLEMPVVLRVPVPLNQQQMLGMLQLEEQHRQARPALGAYSGEVASPLRRFQVLSDA